MTHDQMNVLAALQSAAVAVEVKGIHDIAGLLVSTERELKGVYAENARLLGLRLLASEQRDAALARIAELEAQEPVASVIGRNQYQEMGWELDRQLPVGTKLYAAGASPQPTPPHECKTDAEKTAFAFGWWKALESVQPVQPSQAMELSDLLSKLDAKAGSGFIPWEIEDAYADYIAAINAKGAEMTEPKCSIHPDAPHGFDRNASHTNDRYTCDCEGWVPPEEWNPPERDGMKPSDAYDMINRYFRNNLDDDDYAEYSQALDALAEGAAQATQPAQTGWLDIASAPKDGSRILIHTPHSRHKVQEVWWAIAYEGATNGHWSTPIGPAGRGYTILPEAATHWQPLPAASAHGATKFPAKLWLLTNHEESLFTLPPDDLAIFKLL